jgi:hypothetical protein
MNIKYPKFEIYECMFIDKNKQLRFMDKEELHWMNLSSNEELSEDFIRQNKDKVDWIEICRYQILSKKFIIEFIDRIDFYYIFLNKNISQDIKDYCRMFL